MKKIFIIDGHPYHEGLASQLSREYARGAKKGGHEVRVAELRNLKFDPILRYGYRKRTALERDLIIQQENIKWCDHLVVTTPIWWMSLPALLKGFIDRTFLPGFAYSYGDRKMIRKFIPEGLLKGRTVRVVYTQGSPRWITMFFLFDVHWLLMKEGIFKFVGLGPVRRSVIGNAKEVTKERETKMFREIYRLGKKAL